MQRRLALALAGTAAAAAGVGWALWREQQFERDTSAVWSLRLPQPAGPELEMSRLKGKPTVLNFWATWCPPCIKELPEIERFYRQFSPLGWQVVGIAVDNLGPVQAFLQRVPLTFTIGLAGFEGADLSRRLGNSTGALPFTVVFGADGLIRQRKLGTTSFEELALWARGL